MTTPPPAPVPAPAPVPGAPPTAPAAPAGSPQPAAEVPPAGPPESGPPPAAAPAAPAGDSVGAGDRASQATSRTALGSNRKGLLRVARQRVEGDLVGRDKIVIMAADQAGVTLRTLSPAVVEAARYAFHAPPRWEDIRADAWRHRSVVLRGPDGCGKTAAAVRLMLSGQVRSWYLLDSVAELARLSHLDSLGENPGLLLNAPKDAAALRAPLLAGLEDLLERSDARLVVTVGTDALLDRGLGEYVVRLVGPPDHGKVLSAHLTRLVGERASDEMLAAGTAKALVDELLEHAPSCRYTVRLAEVLAEEHDTGGVDPARVRTRLEEHGGEEPEAWFEGLADPVLRMQAVALAVLNGLPQEDVAWGAAALLNRFTNDRYLHPAPVKGQVPLIRDPFTTPRREQLEQLRARTGTALTRGDFGRLPCTIAEYRDPGYPPRVIKHVWSEYQIQPELLGWLGELVDSASLQVRSFAGTALGLIAAEAFDHFATRVFPQWIHNEQYGERRREAVATALRVCVEDPRLRGGVRAVVEGWYLSGAWQRQAAAARAYGLCLGGSDLHTALEALARLGTVDHIRVAIAIGDSLSDLIEEDVDRNAALVLTTVQRMVGEPRSRACGHLAFLIIADALFTDDPSQTAGSWPTLLRLATDREDLRDLMGRLWQQAVNGELFGEEAAGVLGTWAGFAEGNPQLLDGLVRMVRDLASRDDRTRRLLIHTASRWDAFDALRPLRRTAALLRAVLNA